VEKKLEALITDALRYRYLRKNYYINIRGRNDELRWHLPINYSCDGYSERLDDSIDSQRENSEFNKLFRT